MTLNIQLVLYILRDILNPNAVDVNVSICNYSDSEQEGRAVTSVYLWLDVLETFDTYKTDVYYPPNP